MQWDTNKILQVISFAQWGSVYAALSKGAGRASSSADVSSLAAVAGVGSQQERSPLPTHRARIDADKPYSLYSLLAL